MSRRPGRTKTGTFKAFRDFTLAVARGKRTVDPNEPKIWIETREDAAETQAAAPTSYTRC